MVIIAFIVTLALDMVTKWWAVASLYPDSPLVIAGPVQFNVIFNPGAAFGILPGYAPLFMIISGVVAAGMIIWGMMWDFKLARVASGMVAGGACGNLIDRIWRGAVVDFIDLSIWPVFNVADIGIVVGVILLGYMTIISDLKGRESACDRR